MPEEVETKTLLVFVGSTAIATMERPEKMSAPSPACAL